MSRQSEGSFDDYQRIQESINNPARSASPTPSSRSARRDPSEMYGFGGWIPKDQEPYGPEQLELSEGEETARQSHLPTNAVSHTLHPLAPVDGPSSPSTPRPSPIDKYLNSAPYLSSSDIQKLQRQQAHKRTRGKDTHSSGKNTLLTRSVSTYTESTRDEDEEAYQEHHFTPSHTPSHHSAATFEEDDVEGKAPDSPLPRSNYFPYNDNYGRGAIEGFEERFHGSK